MLDEVLSERRRRGAFNVWVGTGSALLLLFAVSPAAALTIAPDPFSVDFMGVEGEVTLLSVEAGAPAGGTVSLGAISPGDVTLVLGASVDPGSAPGTGVSLSIRDGGGTVLPFTAAGFIPGPDTDVIIIGASGGVVTFTPTTLAGGTVVDPVFLSFAAPLAADGSLTLHASFVSSGQSDGTALLIPEPSTAGLMWLGFAALAVRRRACRHPRRLGATSKSH